MEIVTSVHQKPSKDWLKYVRTGRARTKIRHYVLTEERERSIEVGKESTERELRKWRIDLSRAEKDGDILKVAQDYGFKSEDDLYAAIGYGRVSPKAVITKLVPPQEREKAKAELAEERPVKRHRGSAKSGVRVQGLVDVLVNFAKCCNPLPGDPIRGYISWGRGVTIHKADCVNLRVIDSRRIVDVSWDEDQPLTRVVRLAVLAQNRMGLLATISGVFTSNDSDIVQATMKTINEHEAEGTFMVSVKNLDHLNRVMNALKNVRGIEKVERLGTV